MSTIVVGHDGSETSELAVREAARLAAALGSELHIVVAFSRDSAKLTHEGESWAVGGLDRAEQVIAAARTRHSDALTITDSVSTEDPADALVQAAKEHNAEMIVVGNRRTQGLSRVLGSVASAVVKRAPCSVHIAHTTG